MVEEIDGREGFVSCPSKEMIRNDRKIEEVNNKVVFVAFVPGVCVCILLLVCV